MRAERLEEIEPKTRPPTATTDYRKLLASKEIDAVYISATPENHALPDGKDACGGQARVPREADRRRRWTKRTSSSRFRRSKKLKFTIGYSQRFNPKYAYVRKCIRDGTHRQAGERAGQPAHHAQPRQEDQRPHQALAGGDGVDARPRLPALVPGAGEAGARLFAGELRRDAGSTAARDVPDKQWITVTMDSGMSFVVGGGWSLPLGYPNFSTTWIEMIGTEGAVMVDDSHQDVVLNTMKKGMQLPMSTMPGEFVEHTYAGADGARDGALPRGRGATTAPVLVTPEHARMVMEVYIAADLSAERNEPVNLPLADHHKGKSHEKAAEAHRPRDRRRRPRRLVPRRGRRAPSAGRLDRHRRLEARPREARRGEDEADFVTADFRELLEAARSDGGDHLDRRAPARRADPGGGGAQAAAADREAARHRARRIGSGAGGDQEAGVDAVVGYTQRFRRRWLAAKEKVRTGALGDVTLVTSRAFMNRLVALDNYKRTDDPSKISPMVISGTHALDIVMWMMEAKKPVEVYARSVDKALGPNWQGHRRAPAGVISFRRRRHLSRA